MNAITIVGAGFAGMRLAEKIKKLNAAVPVTLIDKSSVYFDRAELLRTLSLKGKIVIADWAQKYNVTFVSGSLDRISPRRKKLYFKDRDVMDFERVILATGIKSQKVEFKGIQRESVSYLSDVTAAVLNATLNGADDVSVIVTSFVGLLFAVELNNKKKNVTVIMPDSSFLDDARDDIINALKGSSIELYESCKVSEIIGERVARAVKIEPLKVLAANAVFVDSGFVGNSDFFDDPIDLKDVFFTQHPNVLCIGDVTNSNATKVYGSVDINTQVEVLARYIVLEEKLALDQIAQNVDNRTLYIQAIKDALSRSGSVDMLLPKIDVVTEE